MRLPRPILSVAAVGVTALALTGCSTPGTTTDAGSPSPSAAACEPGALPTLTDGVLTVGASDPYEPWYVGERTSGEGFESALVYAVAERLGYEHDDVEWVDVTFDQIVAPAEKPFDLAAYQTTITEQRRTAVDFSSPYLTTRQGVIVADDGPYAGATTLADLEGAKVGVTAAQTSLDAAEAAWGDAVEVVPFSAAGDGMQALSSGQVDAMVMDVDQGVAASTVYFPDTQVVGTLPQPGEPEQLGLVLDKDSALTACVSEAVDALEADGTLASLRTEWLRSDDVPELG
ncbi:ABC transporter substrate-binding protein [Xylanimonas oleitrophica]|uniref:ABC transporter substrate-binding protein n=1 Tax=Xylanimonas oleitrophica TaxID=2607479 RepID=UPI0015D05278|nr:ABC transporter substrate-binding protein [Xylanimonas oleitrophica]